MVYGLDVKDEQLMILALVLALDVVGVIAVQALMIPQQAQAASPLTQAKVAASGIS